ncbi:MAG: hypothetical protein ACOX2F_04510 [bacterium]
MEIKECPQCGANVSPSAKKCDYCKAEFFITSIAYLSSFDNSGIQKYLKHYKEVIKLNPDDIEGHLGLGLCFLQLNMYPMAQKSFEKVIENSPEISESYYYCCLSIIAGRRLKTLPLNEIRKLETFLNTAIQLDDKKEQYKLLLSMIKNDYYIFNGMKETLPSYSEILNSIDFDSLNSSEINRIKETVKVSDYGLFKI